jgi:glycerophosphoryl diester phosphodiesterase
LDGISLYHARHCKFLVIAHRGASYYAPENTMAAFRKAVEMQADMIELDVQLSRDGVPVACHDDNLKRLAGLNSFVHDLDWRELRNVDVGSRFDSDFAGESIPSLEQVLDWAQGTISLNIEIKPGAVTGDEEGGIEQKVVELVKQAGMERHVLISGFDFRIQERLQKMAPEIARGLLYSKEAAQKRSVEELLDTYSPDTLNASLREFRKREMKEAAKKLPVFIYTVNRAWTMSRLIRQGVSGIFSDCPDLLKQVADREIENRCS